MATTTDLLLDSFDRVQALVQRTGDGLTEQQLTSRVGPDANSIAWLIWHLTRIQDDHVADVAGIEQVWIADKWSERFALPFESSATGYGHTSEEVAAVRAPASLLIEYHDAVHSRTVEYVRGLSDTDLDRVVDQSWDPPVTLAVRLVSVLGDGLQHIGQAAFVRGLLPKQ
jgi:hypothetical protein